MNNFSDSFVGKYNVAFTGKAHLLDEMIRSSNFMGIFGEISFPHTEKVNEFLAEQGIKVKLVDARGGLEVGSAAFGGIVREALNYRAGWNGYHESFPARVNAVIDLP